LPISSAITLSDRGFQRLVEALDRSFARGEHTHVEEMGVGLYGPSLFYRAVGTFNLLNVCNHWVAQLLDAAGVPTNPVLATLPPGLLLDLSWRAKVQVVR
jgi:rhamnogalacturonyl hydrolase YesR